MKLNSKISELELIFSKDRINNLKSIYHLSSENTVLLHEQLAALNGTIHASISVLEIHLRNIIVTQLHKMFGANWYDQGIFTTDSWLKNAINAAKKSAKRNNYSKMPHQARRQLKNTFSGSPDQKKKKAINSTPFSEGDLIAHLYFSFWRKLYSKSYEPQLWLFGLRETFPNTKIKRGQVSDSLETCYKVRNRVSHNEFIHPKLCKEYLQSISFLTKELRLRNRLRKNVIYKFQEMYLQKIKQQLSEFSHFLSICNSR